MTIYADDIEKLHKFACPDETDMFYTDSDTPREGKVVYTTDDRGNGVYVRYGHTMEELTAMVQLKLIEKLSG